MEDRLELMMQAQAKFEARLGHADFERMKKMAEGHGIHGTEFLALHKEYSLALMMEGGEIMDWVPWKGWSRQLGNKEPHVAMSESHQDEVRKEIADALHFVLALALLWGMTADDLFKYYTAKNAVNHGRQDTGAY